MIKYFCTLLTLFNVCCSQAKSAVDSGSEDNNDSSDKLTIDEIEADWVVIPNGEFTFGSPYSQMCRGANDEEPVDVIITHSFKMASTEVTRKQWRMIGLQDPSKAEPCDNCAQGWVSWYDALYWLNSLSRAAGLPECYDLSECTGDPNSGCPDATPTDDFYKWGCIYTEGTAEHLPLLFYCPGNVHKYSARWDCPGYRLPTAAEREWAARGGTTTATYAGEVSTEDGNCPMDPAVDDIAWHCGNSDRVLHPVGEKLPNDYGLYDMLGNAGEWVSDVYTGAGLQENEGKEPPLVDPVGKLDEHWSLMKPIKGGFVSMNACRCAATTNFPLNAPGRVYSSGFRPVRTILE